MGRDSDWMYPAILFAAVAASCAAIVSIATGYPSQPSGQTSLTAAVAIAMLVAFCRFIRFLIQLWRAGEEHPAARIRAELRPAIASFVPIVVGIAIIGTFLYSTNFLKSMIPVVVPFWADPALAVTDRLMLIDPEAIALTLSPALPALGIFYGLWHLVHIGSILWVLHWHSGTKARHIVSFMLTWSIGMALAFIFSSMGPIFTGAYDPAVAPGTVQRAAAFLWANYQSDGARIGGGISAFPSMHVAIAAWLALVLRSRGLPKLGILYLAAVFACSVILGWHYAIDGIAGAAIALTSDKVAASWLDRNARNHARLGARPGSDAVGSILES